MQTNEPISYNEQYNMTAALVSRIQRAQELRNLDFESRKNLTASADDEILDDIFDEDDDDYIDEEEIEDDDEDE